MSNELLGEYSNTVTKCLTLADSIAPGELTKVPAAGEWSAGFVLHHMADSEVHFTSRFLNALAEDKPKITTFNEDVYPERLNYAKRDVASSKAVIASLSIFVTNLLMRIPAGDWNRISIHPENGEMTLTDLLANVISHYKAHINQLSEIKSSL